MNYFSEQSNGNFSRSVLFLLYSLGWKLQLLIKMTVGFWNESLIENMQIKSRSVKLNLNKIDGEIRHEDMLYSVGLWHSLIWQIIPYCVFVSKLGESLNESPLFVFDKIGEYTVEIAKRREEEAVMKRNRKKSESNQESVCP
jgi:hypothetical protein